MNGLEIDLKELELFEKRVKEKRAKNPQVTEKTDENSEPDDLDEYLQKLTLENNIRDETVVVEQARAPLDQSMPLLIYTFCGILFLLNYLQHSRRKTKIFVREILFKFMFFKFWISGSDEGLEEDDDDDDDADEEEGDISLGEFFFFFCFSCFFFYYFLVSKILWKISFFIAEVYNDDLEEDNEDWQAGGGNFQIKQK